LRSHRPDRVTLNHDIVGSTKRVVTGPTFPGSEDRIGNLKCPWTVAASLEDSGHSTITDAQSSKPTALEVTTITLGP
jgi:hypothetical protein